MLAHVTTPAQSPERAFPLMGSTVEPLVTGSDTGSAWEAVRTTVGPAGRSPLHTMGTDKVFLVLSGTLVVVVDGDEHELTPGATAAVPSGTGHYYRNDSGSPAQVLVLTTGGGHVAFLRGMSELTAGGPPDATALAELTSSHGVRLLPATVA